MPNEIALSGIKPDEKRADPERPETHLPRFIAPWALRLSNATIPDDDALPDLDDSANVVLNRKRLARWLSIFEADRDVRDFLLVDAIIASLNIPVSSTGVVDSTAGLGLRPFRLWEYCWIYKCLRLGRGGLRILDIGGPATHLSVLAGLAGNRIQSIDINSDFVDAANRAARILALPEYTAFVGDGRDLSVFLPESFDAVVCCSVLEHLTGEDQRTVLGEVARVLRPGGVVGLTFDYGPAAPNANEHLPPPHDPPSSASEALYRYAVGGLQMLGNHDLEEPIPGSLFISDVVHYTIASLFLGRPPLSDLKFPGPKRTGSRIFSRLQIPGLVPRSFEASHGRLHIETKAKAHERAAESIFRIESALEKQSQTFERQSQTFEKQSENFEKQTELTTLLRNQLAAAEGRAAAAENLIAQDRQQIDELNRNIQSRDEGIARWRQQSESNAAESERRWNRIVELEASTAGLAEQLREGQIYAAEVREAELARQADAFAAERSRWEAHAAELSASLQQSVSYHVAKDVATHELHHYFGLLAKEPWSRFVLRRFLGRIPNSDYQYKFQEVPRIFSPAAVLAIAHRLVNLRVKRIIERNNPPASALPRISVVTPVYNGEAYIERAIESVLNQKYPHLEYFIEDGGSTDRTLEIVNRYRDRLTGVTSQPDKGMYDAIGRGFERATGEILCYLNSDDVFLDGALARVGAYFAEHPKSEVIFHEDVVEVNGWRFPNVAQKHVGFNDLLKGHILFQDGVFFRREAYRAAGGVNRELKLAGDWDLWTRMARRSRFTRLPGHVSCFHIREGQLSSKMEGYEAEMAQRRSQIAGELLTLERIRHALSGFVTRFRNRLDRSRSRDRLFFPLTFSQMPPPPGQVPDRRAPLPVCPVTGKLPDRFLFSSRDTRFGHPLINDFYYVSESHMALCYPPLSDEFLNSLHEKNYSGREPSIAVPDPEYGSPYRLYRGAGFLLRFVRNILAPRLLSKFVALHWGDRSTDELLGALTSVGVSVDQPLSFLDVGCFKGSLLDTLRQRTQWSLYGIEPNATAAAAACANGHKVFTTDAMDAVFALPQTQRFDIIFMGQVVEHLSTPVDALIRLSTLLKPGGRLVLTTPNLDSGQIDLFGPAWSHWHPPYHRHLFSLRALEMMGDRAGLKLESSQTLSHPYWSGMSLWLNALGLGAAVPHDLPLSHDIINHARSIATWAKVFWDGRGRGDYLFAVFSKEL